MDKSDELETALVDSYITAKTQSQSDAAAQSDKDTDAMMTNKRRLRQTHRPLI